MRNLCPSRKLWLVIVCTQLVGCPPDTPVSQSPPPPTQTPPPPPTTNPPPAIGAGSINFGDELLKQLGSKLGQIGTDLIGVENYTGKHCGRHCGVGEASVPEEGFLDLRSVTEFAVVVEIKNNTIKTGGKEKWCGGCQAGYYCEVVEQHQNHCTIIKVGGQERFCLNVHLFFNEETKTYNAWVSFKQFPFLPESGGIDICISTDLTNEKEALRLVFYYAPIKAMDLYLQHMRSQAEAAGRELPRFIAENAESIVVAIIVALGSAILLADDFSIIGAADDALITTLPATAITLVRSIVPSVISAVREQLATGLLIVLAALPGEIKPPPPPPPPPPPLPVNRPPVASELTMGILCSDPVEFELEASDPDNDPLTYFIVSWPAQGELTGTPPKVTYTPPAHYLGEINFIFKVNDGQLDSNAALVTIMVDSTLPGFVSNPSPADGSILNEPPTRLAWSPTGSEPVYLVYLEKDDSTPDELVGVEHATFWKFNFTPAPGRWYWQVVATDSCGETAGPIWQFTLQSPPGNDLCGKAIPVGLGRHVGSNVDALTDGYASCAPGSHSDVWFKFRPDACAVYRISTCESDFDTVVSVYDKCGGREVACNDDSCRWYSETAFFADSLEPYFIRVAGAGHGGKTTGEIILQIHEGKLNDLCATATEVGIGTHYSSNVGATTDGQSTCGGKYDVWFRFKPNLSATLEVTTCGSDFDTVLSVYKSCGGGQVTCNDDYCLLQSKVQFFITQMDPYLIRVAGNNGAVGKIVLNLRYRLP